MLRKSEIRPQTLEIIEEVTETEASRSLEAMRDDLLSLEQNNELFRDSQIGRINREANELLFAEINDSAIASGTISDRARSRSEAIHSKNPLVRENELRRGCDELLGITQEVEQQINSLIQDDATASEQIDRGQDSDTALKIMLGAVCLLNVGATAFFIYLLVDLIASSSSSSAAAARPEPPLDQTKLGHRILNLTSMVMEASADNPSSFTKLGISQACYAQVRKAIVDGQLNMPEELWWQLLADQALRPYPETDILLTPANHYMALAFCLDCLQPLYPAQPMDLEIEATVDALASSLNLLDPTCMSGYYARMVDVIPEASGANRAQRIFLARAGLARAFSRMPV